MTENDEQKFSIKSFARELREDIEKNRIKLPTLPAISLEALLVLNDAGSSMADVARIINKDTSMATRLVRYANSPLYGGVHKVTSLKTAITRIGIEAVKHAILSLAMKDVFTTSYKVIQERMEALWRHSVKVASIATLLSDQFSHLNKDEAMLAGLIHDVGTIPILIKAKDYEILAAHGENLDKVVTSLHMLIGKFLLHHWNFDKTFIEVASEHDHLQRVSSAPKVDYVDIIQVANVLSYIDSDHRYRSISYDAIDSFRRVGVERVEQIVESGAIARVEREIGQTLS